MERVCDQAAPCGPVRSTKGWLVPRALFAKSDSNAIMIIALRLINLLEINFQGLAIRKRIENLLKAEELFKMREEIS